MNGTNKTVFMVEIFRVQSVKSLFYDQVWLTVLRNKKDKSFLFTSTDKCSLRWMKLFHMGFSWRKT